jgi:hypothetical protein
VGEFNVRHDCYGMLWGEQQVIAEEKDSNIGVIAVVCSVGGEMRE